MPQINPDYYRAYNMRAGSPFWFLLKDEARFRAKGRCELCGVLPPLELELHHLTYDALYQNRAECLCEIVVLCRHCHAQDPRRPHFPGIACTTPEQHDGMRDVN